VTARGRLFLILAAAIILAGTFLRVAWMRHSALWCDEAESSINALTILDRGFPFNEYLGIPIYENTLTEPWDGHPEYEFRDSSYSPQGLAVYHGWLPLYAIAASQAICGLRPDHSADPPAVQHGVEQISRRTIAPRLPSIAFAVLCMASIYFLAGELGGVAAGFAALTLMAFNAKTVDFGYEARYYSLTLLATVLVAWCLLRVARAGRWRDYLLLATSEAVLFHTHQLSAVVMAATAVVLVPRVLRQRYWFFKGLAAAALSSALIFPWILVSGFLATASSVPKAFRLFDSPGDWLAYTLARPDQLAVLGTMAALLIIWKARPDWLPGWIRGPLREHAELYAALLVWMVFAYGAFHLLVPAASFFYERLSLMLWVPYVLVLSLLLADMLRGAGRWAPVLAIVVATSILAARGRLAFFESPSVTASRPAIAAVIRSLESHTIGAGTLFYATPNEHLVYTYYTGLPVQSVAPVRRSFFAACRRPIVFIEYQMESMFPSEASLLGAAASAGKVLTRDQVAGFSDDIWRTLASDELNLQGIRTPPLPPVPAFLEPAVVDARAGLVKYREEMLSGMKVHPVFRQISPVRTKDLWMGFFYRFVHPEDRIGANLNIFPRLQDAALEFLPLPNAVIFRIPGKNGPEAEGIPE